MIFTLKKQTNFQITENFWLEEFHCKCSYPDCIDTKVSAVLIGALQTLRRNIGSPIKVHSGYRCIQHNKDVSGTTKSKHLEGIAADISSANIHPGKLYSEAKRIDTFSKGGLGLYSWGIHTDVRTDGPARW